MAAAFETGRHGPGPPYSNTDDSGGLAAGEWSEKFSHHRFTHDAHVMRIASSQDGVAARAIPFALKVEQSGPMRRSAGSGWRRGG